MNFRSDRRSPGYYRNVCRRAAQVIVRNGFDMKRAVAEIRPDIKCWDDYAEKLMKEPGVLYEIGAIMNRTERDAKRFKEMLWSWAEKLDKSLTGELPAADKSTTDAGLTAARILARGYIRDKGPVAMDSKPMVIAGLGDEIVNLTGETPVHPETDPKKVV